MMGIAEEDDEAPVDGLPAGKGDTVGVGETDQEEEPVRRYRRRNPFISAQCGVC